MVSARVWMLFGTALVLVACQGATSTATVTTPATVASAEHAKPAGCPDANDGTTALTNDLVQTHTDAQGRTVTHVGGTFAATQVVSVQELLAKPESYAGKTVQVSGNVNAMCTHARGWFSIVGDDQTGHHLRVVTAPTFLVPQGSIGKSARAEGLVEVQDVDPEMLKHYAAEHKLGGDQNNTKRVVLRAFGAEFI